ncbi:PREDICTED: serine/threonine-protein phosphatase 7 long form homolog [Erythranthe guttata]|uniref:serine/threonine-protein phosphatase 7 long form homolog n=1 Tax=Erythranthe guttata TaxID=4155 RepID=UPI00064D8604|nr:PREDICTED: serine/threonine-protein phosphatase 7 long form homolog [Erythranthe guttata]|eukprot:XP_012853787.1 PREDICTED: serine/threonine-protein phosphatase 7 long form homolog [Erythranthe guttata]
MENAVYGPRDPSLLYLQNDHRSSALTDSNMDTSIRVRRSDHGIWSVFHRPHNPHPHPRVLSYLVQMKLYGVYRCRRMQADWALITALVERWRQETHTFHLRVGEVTVTLQDVALIYGLPVDGRPVIGVDTHRRTREWQQYCMTWLGFAPDSSKIKGSKLSVKALSEYLINNPVLDSSTYEHLVHYTRGIAFLIVGGIMCPDHTGDSIPLLYLRHLEDLDAVSSYSWGSCTLAVLYHELCKASKISAKEISGPVQLLQIWAWMRIPPSRPIPTLAKWGTTLEYAGYEFPVPPYGARWTNHVSFIETGAHVLRIFRMMLDQMLPDQFIWMPYDLDDPEYQAVAGDSAIACSGIWVSRVPLICYAIVEMHRPDRIVRQFGMVQPIPEPPENTETDFRMHVNANRTGATNRDWRLTHVSHVTAWDNRLDYIIDYPYASDSQTTEDGYFEWYELHTRRFISPITPSDRTGFQVGGQISMDTVIQHLRSLIVSVDGGDIPRDGYRSYLPTLRTCLNVLESRHGPSDRPQSEMPYTQTHAQTQTQIPLSQMPQSQTQMYAGEAGTSSRAYCPAFDNYTDPRSHGHPSGMFSTFDFIFNTIYNCEFNYNLFDADQYTPYPYFNPNMNSEDPIHLGSTHQFSSSRPVDHQITPIPYSQSANSSSDEDEQVGRGHRTRRPPRCGTGGHRHW